jgi:hypothetical protein
LRFVEFKSGISNAFGSGKFSVWNMGDTGWLSGQDLSKSLVKQRTGHAPATQN